MKLRMYKRNFFRENAYLLYLFGLISGFLFFSESVKSEFLFIFYGVMIFLMSILFSYEVSHAD